MKVIDNGEGLRIDFSVSEDRALRNKQYLLARAGRNIDGPLGERLLDCSSAIADLLAIHGTDSERLDREDKVGGIPEPGDDEPAQRAPRWDLAKPAPPAGPMMDANTEDFEA